MLFLIIRKQFTSLSILFTVISLPINSFPPIDQQGDRRWLDSFSLVIHVWNIFLTLCSSSIIYMPVSFHINYIQFWLEVVQIIQIQTQNHKIVFTSDVINKSGIPQIIYTLFFWKACGFPYFLPAKRSLTRMAYKTYLLKIYNSEEALLKRDIIQYIGKNTKRNPMLCSDMLQLQDPNAFTNFYVMWILMINGFCTTHTNNFLWMRLKVSTFW